jgi:AcrR family transcriptional regulator
MDRAENRMWNVTESQEEHRVTRETDAPSLGATDWVEAGLQALADHGVEGIRVERLAKGLGVTKGSFYWHFRDREALLEAMLQLWRRRATLDVIERLNRTAETPVERFRALMRLQFKGTRARQGAAVELAMRLWARRDMAARAAMEEVDDLRLRYIAGLLQDCGTPPHEADARAVLAYSYMRVASTLVTIDQEATLGQCEALVMGAPTLAT